MVALHSGNFEQVIFAFGQLKLRATSPNRGKPFAAIGCRQSSLNKKRIIFFN
jgi:hypothetical protein